MREAIEFSVRLLRAVVALAVVLPQPIFADTIYKSTGPGGPVYSDVPSPGSVPVDLPPPNIAEPPARPAVQPTVPAHAKDAVQPEALAYRSLRITQPEDEGSASDNTALFEVRVAVEPALQIDLGHAFVVTLNGRTVDRRYTSSEMMVPPEFFGDGVSAGERFHLTVRIEDRDGRVLIEAAPVDFSMRHVVTRPEAPLRPMPVRPDRR